MPILPWLFSRTVRRATDVLQHVRRLVNEQRDLLKPEAIDHLETATARLKSALDRSAARTELEEEMKLLIQTADKWLIPYPNASMRENIKEVIVALTLILSITTFFLQLTKIPTNSMLPTLYGITHENLIDDPEAVIPGRITRFVRYWTKGISYVDLVAEESGRLSWDPPKRLLPFVNKQAIRVGDRSYTIWFPPENLPALAGWSHGQYFAKGEPIVRLKVVAGDHLLVDRFTYNFRRPERGEIIVFKTAGIENLSRDQQKLLYIKRLVALPGERVQINDRNHLVINGDELTAATPRFENVYTFKGPYKPGGYFGHANEEAISRIRGHGQVVPFFRSASSVYTVSPNGYLAMGDNTLNSSDSRSWGEVPRRNVIGKYWFVYWPFTERFGWGVR